MQGKKLTSKSARVHRMFSAIAPRYDLLNHLLSLNTDRRWRRFTATHLRPILERPAALALDLCCGTGDLALELGQYAKVIGLDFCHPMLLGGQEKIARAHAPVALSEGDALHLPFPTEQFDVVTLAFGLRNLEEIKRGLQEIHQVLKPGGWLAILEFSRPVMPILGRIFNIYFKHILPRIGSLVSGASGPYQYLRDSVLAFPDQEQLAALLRRLGYSNVSYYNLTGGIAALHLGEKPLNPLKGPREVWEAAMEGGLESSQADTAGDGGVLLDRNPTENDNLLSGLVRLNQRIPTVPTH